MMNKAIVAAMAAAIGLGGVAVPDAALARGFFDLMNPFEWFDDDDDWDRWGGPYGRWGGPYGWGGPYALSGPWGYPGYARGNTVIVLPDGGTEQAALDLPE